MTKSMILDYLRQHKSELNKKYGVSKIGLFGSYARNEANSNSDIDIAIEIDKEKKNIHTFFAIKREMEEIFGQKVDLGIESSLKPIALENIKTEIIYV